MQWQRPPQMEKGYVSNTEHFTVSLKNIWITSGPSIAQAAQTVRVELCGPTTTIKLTYVLSFNNDSAKYFQRDSVLYFKSVYTQA